MDTFTKRQDPDEMPNNVSFHQGLHCLLREDLQTNTYNFFVK